MKLNRRNCRKIFITAPAYIMSKEIQKGAILRLYEDEQLIQLSSNYYVHTEIAKEQGLKWRYLYEE
jgi:hypothetical protein